MKAMKFVYKPIVPDGIHLKYVDDEQDGVFCASLIRAFGDFPITLDRSNNHSMTLLRGLAYSHSDPVKGHQNPYGELLDALVMYDMIEIDAREYRT